MSVNQHIGQGGQSAGEHHGIVAEEAPPNSAPFGLRHAIVSHWQAIVSITVLTGLLAVAISGNDAVARIVAVINAGVVLTIALLQSSANPRRRRLDRRLEQLQDLQWRISDNESRYLNLLDEQVEMILRRDMDGRLTFINRSFAETFDLDQNGAIGTKYQPTVISTDGKAKIELTGDLHRRRSTELVVTRDGTRWIEWEEHAIPKADGKVPEVQAIGRDVTEDLQAAKDLSEARDQAESANRAKSRFLAAMSHEIRTPMNGILGMASLLIETEQNSEQRTYTNAIDQSARNLVTLIDEILDFSKIEAGKLTLKPEPFSIAGTIQGVVELFAASAQQKGLQIAWHISEEADNTLLGDPARVRQIILNLVSNAVKFTDEGGIIVKAWKSGSVTRIAVEDTGIGLTQAEAKNLFVEFEQADAAVKRQRGGTGLGLAISKKLARAMSGDITINSTPGQGSIFTVDLDLPIIPEVASKPEMDTSLRVLLAFDKTIERFAMLKLLKASGITVQETSFKSAAKQIEKAAEAGRPYDRIIVELDADSEKAGQLLEKARQATKGTDRSPKSVRGIVLVSVLTRRNLDAFRNVGFDAYLVRPVRPGALLQHIGAIAPQQVAAVDHGGRTPAPSSFGDTIKAKAGPRRKTNVLVAEDNDINALLATRILEKSGCKVTRVRNGREAVEKAARAVISDAKPYDIIFMDIFMPELDGLEAASEIRSLYATNTSIPHPPIVALTANAFSEDRERYLAAGMDDYLAKPFEIATLQSVLERWTGGIPQPENETAPAA